MDQLYYELVHNLVVETTRTGIEVKNLKMRIESISSRLEFNERRARALESAVVYKAQESDEAPAQRSAAPPTPSRQQPSQPRYNAPVTSPAPAPIAQVSLPVAAATPAQGQPPQGQQQGPGVPGEGPGQRSRRRRRRRGRRGGAAASSLMGVPGSPAAEAADAAESPETIDQAEALDRMEDDGAPESEEMDEAAAEPQAPVEAEPRRAESAVEHAGTVQANPSPGEAAPAVSAEPVAAPPATPDHADHDPQ